jgi:hypothetical protein
MNKCDSAITQENQRAKDARGKSACLRSFLNVAFLLALVFPSHSFAVITFQRTYGGLLHDEGYCVEQTSDGGYIISGVADLEYPYPVRAYTYLVKTDSLGDTLWTRRYGSDTLESFGRSCEQTLDGGYMVAGSTRVPGSMDEDVYVIKTDSLGDTLWTRTFGDHGTQYAMSVQQTSDNGYIVAAYTDDSLGPPSGVINLIKMDSLGDTMWTRRCGDADTMEDIAYSVRQTFDGGYIVAGVSDCVMFPSGDVYLIKTDSLGYALWTKTYGRPGSIDIGFSVWQTLDSGYVVGGCVDLMTDSSDVYLIKTDAAGDSVWTRTYGGSHADEGYSAQQTSDGGYIIAGWTYSFSPTGPDLYLVKTDSMGGALWTRVYYGVCAQSVWQTTDGGYAAAGDAWSFGAGGTDVYLLKTDEYGLVQSKADGGVVSIDAPEDTVFADSTCEVRATVRNFGNAPDTIEVVVSIDGYGDTASVQNLGPGAFIQLTFKNWQVPPADSANYTMTVCANVPDDMDSSNDCMTKSIFAHETLGIDERADHRSRVAYFSLDQNEPNPFSPSTIIAYSLPAGCHVSLKVYDITGRPVETLVDQNQEAGAYQLRWRTENHASGIYFCRVQAGEQSATHKMILLR